MESIDVRKSALIDWLRQLSNLSLFRLETMVGDASMRRYFRVYTPRQSFVAMDAKPPQENCVPFVAIAKALSRAGLNAPAIIAADIPQGFLLLTDFGHTTFQNALNEENAALLYSKALKALLVLQQPHQVDGWQVPPFTADWMWKEWAWHKEWFLEKWLKIQLTEAQEKALDGNYAAIVDLCVAQPQVFMHRDFHSANLMLLPQNEVGILDFQDAFIGPLTYDLASLLRDAYVAWPKEAVTEWALFYFNELQQSGALKSVSSTTFLRWFDFMSMQRHLKALMTFSRKAVRDHEPRYLQHVPRTMQYLVDESSHYAETKALHTLLVQKVLPALKGVNLACAL